MCLVGGSIFFQEFVRLGTLFLSSNAVHQDCIRFCFMSMLRTELYQVAEMWNQHLIASSKFGNVTVVLDGDRTACLFSVTCLTQRPGTTKYLHVDPHGNAYE